MQAGGIGRVWVAFAGLVALRAVLAWFVPSPYIFPDELVYTELARSLIESGQTTMRGQFLNFPTLLYPLLIAPFEGFADARTAYRAIQAFNAVLVTSAIFPVYLLARVYVSGRLALGVAVLSQLLPSTLYATLAMTENVFFPILMWAAYFAVKACSAPEARWKVGLGVALALGFFAKPHGMVALPVVLAALVAWRALGPEGVQGALRRAAAFWPTFALLGAAVVAQIVRAAVISGGRVDAGALFGSYASGLDGTHPFNLFWFGFAALGTLLAVGMSVGFLPMVLFALFAEEAWQDRKMAEGALAVFTVVLGGLLLAITANHTVTLDDGLRLHERYCFHLAPLLLVGAAAVAARERPTWEQIGLTAVFAGSAAAYLLTALRSPLTVDSLTYSAFFRLAETYGARPIAFVAGLLMVVLVGLGGLAWKAGQPGRASALLGIYMIGMLGLAFGAVRWTSLTWGGKDRYATFIAEKTAGKPEAPIAFIRSDGHFWDYQMVEFHSRREARTYQLVGEPTGFNEERSGLKEDGELAGLRGLPDGTLVVAAENVPLALPVLARYDGLTLHEKRGAVRLSDKKQVAELIAGLAPPEAAGK